MRLTDLQQAYRLSRQHAPGGQCKPPARRVVLTLVNNTKVFYLGGRDNMEVATGSPTSWDFVDYIALGECTKSEVYRRLQEELKNHITDTPQRTIAFSTTNQSTDTSYMKRLLNFRGAITTQAEWDELLVSQFAPQLSAPQITVDTRTNILTWNKVPNASGYIVSIDGVEKPSTMKTSYSLSVLTEYKTYQIKVKAKSKGYIDADWSNAVEYTVQELNTETDGLLFAPINGGAAYSVSVGTATESNIVIPSVHEGLPVTQIAKEGFRNCNFITSVVIPDSVICHRSMGVDHIIELVNL
jgi:hypothetical protein